MLHLSLVYVNLFMARKGYFWVLVLASSRLG